MRRGQNKKVGGAFWNKEYKQKDHLRLSENPSEDLMKFTRHLEREYGRAYLNPLASALDLGCGNGRNLVYLSKTFGMRGIGYDISSEAIAQAQKLSAGLPLTYEIRSIAGEISLPDGSQTLVLDMMTSHFLNNAERENLYTEILRVLKPGGWLFLKTFLRDEDTHAERLLREHPGGEAGSYIHPEIKVEEHVFTEDEITEELGRHFFVHKVLKSHRHKDEHGRPGKRRSISLYAQKS